MVTMTFYFLFLVPRENRKKQEFLTYIFRSNKDIRVGVTQNYVQVPSLVSSSNQGILFMFTQLQLPHLGGQLYLLQKNITVIKIS